MPEGVITSSTYAKEEKKEEKRPAYASETHKKITSVAISRMLDEELERESKKQKVSKSKLIESIVLDWLRRKAKEEAKIKREIEEKEKDKGKLLAERYMRKILFDYEHADQYGWQPVEAS
ncbi:MAG: hypothetical protein QW175_06860 [Candidatus Bathyarchaeia archaeon]